MIPPKRNSSSTCCGAIRSKPFKKVLANDGCFFFYFFFHSTFSHRGKEGPGLEHFYLVNFKAISNHNSEYFLWQHPIKWHFWKQIANSRDNGLQNRLLPDLICAFEFNWALVECYVFRLLLLELNRFQEKLKRKDRTRLSAPRRVQHKLKVAFLMVILSCDSLE